jgi:hypothetical protein
MATRTTMGEAILMFTWTEVREALETLADGPQRRKAAWLLERLKRDSEMLSSSELLVEIINSAVLLGAECNQPVRGLQNLLDG